MNLHTILTTQTVWLIRACTDENTTCVWLVATEDENEAHHIADLVERSGLYEVECDKIEPGWITTYAATHAEILRDYEPGDFEHEDEDEEEDW